MPLMWFQCLKSACYDDHITWHHLILCNVFVACRLNCFIPSPHCSAVSIQTITYSDIRNICGCIFLCYPELIPKLHFVWSSRKCNECQGFISYLIYYHVCLCAVIETAYCAYVWLHLALSLCWINYIFMKAKNDAIKIRYLQFMFMNILFQGNIFRQFIISRSFVVPFQVWSMF